MEKQEANDHEEDKGVILGSLNLHFFFISCWIYFGEGIGYQS